MRHNCIEESRSQGQSRLAVIPARVSNKRRLGFLPAPCSRGSVVKKVVRKPGFNFHWHPYESLVTVGRTSSQHCSRAPVSPALVPRYLGRHAEPLNKVVQGSQVSGIKFRRFWWPSQCLAVQFYSKTVFGSRIAKSQPIWIKCGPT